jgi:hypothetical protein
MRHALGLHGSTPSRSTADHPTTSIGGSQPQRRRFVRDGEVPVTVIRRDHQPDGEPGTNQLDAARQTIRAEAIARERAERSLEEAQVTIRDLQTKLAHERLAKDEALEAAQRVATAEQSAQQTLQSIQAELVAQSLAFRTTKDALADAQEGRHVAEGRLRQAIADQQARKPSRRRVENPTGTKRKILAVLGPDAQRYATGTMRATVPARRKKTSGPAVVDDDARTIQARRRGRPAKTRDQESPIVEWWKPRSMSTGGISTGGTLKPGRGRPKGSKNRPKP